MAPILDTSSDAPGERLPGVTELLSMLELLSHAPSDAVAALLDRIEDKETGR